MSPTGGDLAGGDVHEPYGTGGSGEELERAVVVRERVAVRVPNGDVLVEGEIGGVVEERESWEFHGIDGDFGVLRAEEDEAGDDSGDYDGGEEESGE